MSQESATTSDATELVFIYGNLRVGGPEAFRMDGARHWRKAEAAGILLEFSGRPALVPRYGRERHWVTGDLFHVSPAHLAALDSPPEPGSETDGTHYQRERIKVYELYSQKLVGEAWVWQWTGSTSGANIVRSGNWMEVVRPRCAPWFTLLAAGCLIGLFPAVGFMAMAAHKPTPSFVKQIIGPLILLVPLVGVVAAWWGLRRRERCEVLAVLLLCVFVVLAILVLIVLAMIFL